jgi:ParB-like nuclease domain
MAGSRSARAEDARRGVPHPLPPVRGEPDSTDRVQGEDVKKPGATIALSTLKPNERNPRRISDTAFENLCKSIKRDPRFMELRPMIVDAKGVIIGGNQRYRALLKLGKKKVPASWVIKAADLTPEQRRRFILIDNAPEGAAGYWDYTILQEQYKLPDLKNLGFVFGEAIDQAEVWKGMPEFENEAFRGYKQLVVRFLKKQDYEKFATLIGQKLTEKTKAIWYPKHDFDSDGRDVEYDER